MTLLRINHTAPPLLRLRDEMDQLFNEVFEARPFTGFGGFGRRAFPAFNVWEDDTSLFAEAEIPGLTMDDLELVVVGNELTVKGERQDVAREGITHHRRERGVGAFARTLRLPVDIDADKVQATLRDGVLTVTMPKAQAVLPRKIEVKS